MPGLLQLSTDTQVHLLNTLLSRVTRDLQLTVPPRAIRYDSLAIDFRTDKGLVLTDRPWVTLGGVQIVSSPNLAIGGTVRLHGARNSESLKLQDVLGVLIHD
jgi:hypothetical protein